VGEEVAGLPEAPAVDAPGRGGTDELPAGGGELAAEPIGAYLSRQRRLRGIRLDELARVTCIPLRSLERLEAGAFDGTPDGFARGFVRTVASALGLDPDDAVERMLPEATPSARRRDPALAEPSPWPGLVLAVLATAAVGIVLVEWSGGDPDAGEPGAQRVYRRDAVRELARSEGLLADGVAAERGLTAPSVSGRAEPADASGSGETEAADASAPPAPPEAEIVAPGPTTSP